MKKTIMITLAILLWSSWLSAQSGRAFTVVETTASERVNLRETHTNNPDVFFNEAGKPSPYVILQMIMGKQVEDLHLYLDTRPGILRFSSGEIMMSNINDYKDFFADWSSYIKGKVIIHSKDLFTGESGEKLQKQLEEITGLRFEMR